MRVLLFVIICYSICYPMRLLATSYDQLSFLEEPVSYETQHGVIELNSVFDFGYRSDDNGNAKYDTVQAIADISYKTQLSNDWDLSINYTADIANERSDSYEDLFRVSIEDQWGEVQVGTVSSVIFDQTKRQDSIGLLGVENDNFTLSLERYGVFYQWSTPTTQWMIATDKDANIELGASYYAIAGGLEYVFALHANAIDKDKADPQGVSDSMAVAVMAQVQRGRWIMDAQYMHEELEFLNNSNSFELQGISAGLHYAFNRWEWSLTGQNRENEFRDEERTIALGLRFDIARGLSLNAGASVKNTKLFSERYKSFATSLRYEF